MSFPFSDMRMRNIMAPSADSAQQTNTPIPAGGIGMGQNIGLADQSQPQVDINDLLNAQDAAAIGAGKKPFVPEMSNVMSQKLQQALDMMPQRGDYKPSKFRKIMASIASVDAKDPISQQQAIDDIQYKPYYQDMNDWMTHVNALMKGASEEDKANLNARIYGLTGIKLGQNQQKLGQNQQGLDIKQADSDAKIAHLKWLEEHPDWKPIQTKGGNRIFFNPKDPTQTYDSGIPTGSSTDTDLENLRQKGRQAIANTRAAAEIAAAKERGEQARETKKTPTAKQANETPQQTRIRLYNNAVRAINEHPEWKDYITIDPEGRTNDFQVNPPANGWFTSGPDREKNKQIHDAIYDYIYGSQPVAATGGDPGGLGLPPKK
jgi:hypothetical protein